MVNGNDVRLFVGGRQITSNTNCTLSFGNDIREATLSPSLGYTQYITGVKTTSLSFEGFFDFDVTQISRGTLIEWAFSGRDLLYTGEGYLESINIIGPTDSIGAVDGNIKVTGEVTSTRANFNQELCDRDVTLCDDDVQLCTQF